MSGSSVTPPKGRATRARNEATDGRSFMNPMVQWALVVVVGLVIMAAIFYFGGDIRSDLGGGGGHSGAPAEVPVVMADPLGV